MCQDAVYRGMNYRQTTIVILVAVVVALSLWDIAVDVTGGNEATISRVFLETAKKYPAIPFLVGCLMGHLFLSQSNA